MRLLLPRETENASGNASAIAITYAHRHPTGAVHGLPAGTAAAIFHRHGVVTVLCTLISVAIHLVVVVVAAIGSAAQMVKAAAVVVVVVAGDAGAGADAEEVVEANCARRRPVETGTLTCLRRDRRMSNGTILYCQETSRCSHARCSSEVSRK